MLDLRYNGEDTIYKVSSFKNIGKHIIKCGGLGVANTVGFTLSREGHQDNWDYSTYTTIYRKIDDDIYFSDDGSVYVEPPVPTPQPAPEPYIPPIEAVREEKIQSLHSAQQQAIEDGVTVRLSTGAEERFTLTSKDQESLLELQTQVDQGVAKIAWHNANKDEPSKYYSNADMAKIIKSAFTYISYHVTLFRDFRIYINTLEDRDKINEINYIIADLPISARSQVLKDLLAQL